MDNQRLRDWTEYGQALKTQIESAVSRRQLLRVPVVVHVDVKTFRVDAERRGALQDQLLQEAIMNTPLPGATQPLRISPDRPPLSPLLRLTAPALASGRQHAEPAYDQP